MPLLVRLHYVDIKQKIKISFSFQNGKGYFFNVTEPITGDHQSIKNKEFFYMSWQIYMIISQFVSFNFC